MNLHDFLNNNSSAIFALIGALGTGLLQIISSWLLRKRDYSLKLWEKISERRIRAHEQLLESAMQLRVMIAYLSIDENGEPIRVPQIMKSKATFDQWLSIFSSINSGSPWQTTEAKREANFVQDYMVTLFYTTSNIPTELFPNVGLIIRQDIIDISSSLERATYKFFERDIRKLEVSRLSDWHKYPLHETERRLQASELLKNQESIANLSHPALATPLMSNNHVSGEK